MNFLSIKKQEVESKMKLNRVLIILIAIIIPCALSAQNYQDALQKAIIFYDANKCGTDVATGNSFSWRGACHTTDGGDVGVNLTGGYHDAGDHVKFGLPQGYAAAVLGWALYEYRAAFDSLGYTTKLLSQLKYFTDYFIKSYSNGNFYYQVGNGDLDHAYWGAPEVQDTERPTYALANSSKAASDVLGETSAALSLMYLNYKSTNSTYASQCLSLARTLYNMGKTTPGYGDGQSYYQSHSDYDDLSWAAVWLYVIDGTASLITDINGYLSNPTKTGDQPLVKNHWTMCWDDMGLAVLAKLTMLTGDSKYKTVLEENFTYWMNTLEKTPGGLRFLHYWGVLRYAAAESMVMLLYYRYTGNATYRTFAKSQIDYIFSNPAGLSYMIGYGSSWPVHPHHRAANGYTYIDNGNTLPAKNLITGAMVGGPDQSDTYKDSANEYQYTEVAIDYNAGLVGALAGMLDGSVSTPGPTAVPTATPATTPQTGTKGDVNGSGAVDIVDALLVAQYYVGLTPSSFNATLADVNCSGGVDIVDALLIAQYYVGLTTAFPC
jgi:hypothetical protein